MGTKDSGDKCYENALPDEPMFVLLARDKQAPELIRKWAKDRENSLSDPELYLDGTWRTDVDNEPEKAQIAEARYLAARMEVWRYENDGKWRAG